MSLEDDCVHAVEIDGIYECGDSNPAILCIPGGDGCTRYKIVADHIAKRRQLGDGFGTVEPMHTADWIGNNLGKLVIGTVAVSIIAAKILHHIIST